MTILPKKKVQTTNDAKAPDPVHQPLQQGLQPQVAESIGGRDRLFIAPGANSPPRWGPSTSRIDEKRPASSASRFEEDEEFGPSHSKRRHRGSPLRTFRQKHRERGSSSPILPGTAPSASTVSAPSPPPVASASSPSSPNSDDRNGYNSGDEYGPLQFDLTEEEWLEKERRFEKKMRKRGLLIKAMNPDGACLFRSVSDQVYGDQEMHSVVRQHCMDYIIANADYFRQWITEDLQTYVMRKRIDHVQGNHVEIQAMSEMYNRPIEVFCYSSEPINIFQGHQQNTEMNPAIRLSYHRGVHYNSLVDPMKATIGVGLGLPGHVPGSADRSLMRDALRQSEETEIERTMMEDKVKATDWEATNEAIEEHIARESYIEWLRENERRSKPSRASSLKSPDIRSPRHRGESSTKSSVSNLDVASALKNSPKLSLAEKRSPCRSPQPGHSRDQLPSTSKDADRCDFKLAETSSFLNQLPPDVFGISDWDDADVLAKVLAESQAEYLNSLKHRACSSAASSDSEH